MIGTGIYKGCVDFGSYYYNFSSIIILVFIKTANNQPKQPTQTTNNTRCISDRKRVLQALHADLDSHQETLETMH
jgi:hypothetical protein